MVARDQPHGGGAGVAMLYVIVILGSMIAFLFLAIAEMDRKLSSAERELDRLSKKIETEKAA